MSNSSRAARQGVDRYITFYNTVRPHQALGYRTPAAVYASAAQGQAG